MNAENLTEHLAGELRAAGFEDVNAGSLDDIRTFRSIIGGHVGRIADEHREGGSGRGECRALTAVMDTVVGMAYRRFFDRIPQGTGPALIALGGYGRSELNPHSDIDVLFLYDGAETESFGEATSGLLQFLWDLRLELGHSTRTVEECLSGVGEDTNLATSLLESRFVIGNEPVWTRFRRQFIDWLENGAGIHLALGKINERHLRLGTYHDTVKVQEPNIKESPGGLRDIHTARWLMMLIGLGGRLETLFGEGFLYDYEIARYREAFDFLLRVRNGVHFTAGKKADQLEHLLIPDYAENLGYTGTGSEPSEAFMRDYYTHAIRVYRLTNHVEGRFLERFGVEHAGELRVDPSGLVIVGNRAGFQSLSSDFLVRHPGYLVRIFAVAGSRTLGITGYATTVIEKYLSQHDEPLAGNDAVRAEFHAMMDMKEGLGTAFRLMHEHGVLERLIPEFTAISSHYQYNYYHEYTTDEHTIRTVENLERMVRGTFDTVPELHGIMSDVTARGALYLGGLLHDVGKGRGKGHSQRGERLATQALERLGCDRRTIDLVRFLIREHLLMSHISQRRDMDDEDTIRGCVERIGSTGRLRMLTLLTFADVTAVSPTAMTEWKKALLLRLYRLCLRAIEKGFEHRETDDYKREIEHVVGRLAPAHDPGTVRSHLLGLPEQYVRVSSTETIGRHLDGIRHLPEHGVWSSIRRQGDFSTVTVITTDYPRALSEICGVLTAVGINIIGAQIFTREDGVIIDSFLVVNNGGEAVISGETKKELKSALEAVVHDRADVEDMIRAYRRRWRRRRKKTTYSPPRVRIANDISSHYTVMDVFAPDYTGLLYDITSVLASFNINIGTARIGTDEDRAADAFYLQSAGGEKLGDPALLDRLAAAVRERIEQACPS